MPYVIMLMLIPNGKLFDWLRSTGKFRLITLRKMYNTIGKLHGEIRSNNFHIKIRFVSSKGFLVPFACNLLLMALPKEVSR